MLRTADVDDDGVKEVVAAEPGRGLLAIDPVAGTIDLSFSEFGVTALDVADLDGDDVPDIVIGSEDGFVYRVDIATGDATTVVGPFPAPIDAVAVADIIDDGVPDFVVCVADTVQVVDGATTDTLWVSADLGSDVGQNDSLLVADLDLDGRTEIWVNAGPVGHLIFEIVEIEKRPDQWQLRSGARRVTPGETLVCPPN